MLEGEYQRRVIHLLEGMRYDQKTLLKQQNQLQILLQRLIESRVSPSAEQLMSAGDNESCSLTTVLPISSHEELLAVEGELEERRKRNALVGVGSCISFASHTLTYMHIHDYLSLSLSFILTFFLYLLF